jgi:cytochrome bd-type quinol oxidase subunit 2
VVVVLFMVFPRGFAYLFIALLAAAVSVAFIMLGFGVAMYPALVLGELSIEAAAPRETLRVFLWVLPGGLMLLGPALFLLYWTFRGAPDPQRPPEDRARKLFVKSALPTIGMQSPFVRLLGR